jgi:hypothetical protein
MSIASLWTPTQASVFALHLLRTVLSRPSRGLLLGKHVDQPFAVSPNFLSRHMLSVQLGDDVSVEAAAGADAYALHLAIRRGSRERGQYSGPHGALTLSRSLTRSRVRSPSLSLTRVRALLLSCSLARALYFSLSRSLARALSFALSLSMMMMSFICSCRNKK